MRYIEAREKVIFLCQYVGTADEENGEYMMAVSNDYSPVITLPNGDRVSFGWEDLIDYANAVKKGRYRPKVINANPVESIDPEVEPWQQRNFDKLMQAYGNPDLTKAQRKSFEYLAKDEDSVIDSLCETARLIRGIR